MDLSDIMQTAANGGGLPKTAAAAAASNASVDAQLGLPADASDEQRERCRNMFVELQECLDERARGLGELIERTVSIHKAIQEDVAKMWAQDREEDLLVKESQTRTDLAERELQRNPRYEEFKKRAPPAGTAVSWPTAGAATQHAEWTGLVTLSAEECKGLLRYKKGETETHGLSPESCARLAEVFLRGPAAGGGEVFVKVGGEPVYDLSMHGTDSGRDVLGAAAALVGAMRCDDVAAAAAAVAAGDEPPLPAPLTPEELHRLHALLQCVKAQPLAASVEDFVEKLVASRRFVREHVTPAVIHDRALHLAAAPLSGLLLGTPLRCYVMRGALRAVEAKHPSWTPPPAAACLRNDVEAFVAGCCEEVAGTDSFVLDVVYYADTARVSVQWVHKLCYDMLVDMTWETLCSTAAGTAPVHWHTHEFAQGPEARRLEDPALDKQTFCFLASEKANLLPGRSCWESSKQRALAHSVSEAGGATASLSAGGDAERHVDAHAGLPGTILMTTVAVAATSFLAGYLASKRS